MKLNKDGYEVREEKATVTVTNDTGEEEKSETTTCTVAKLLNIIGGLEENFNCFANFDHFYLGNTGKANALELSLKYLPDDLLHSDLPADWTLEGNGTLPYNKDPNEPKWKGKTPLTWDTHGRIEYTAKWGSIEVKKKFTKFSLKLLQVAGDRGRNLYGFKTKKRSTGGLFYAAILPSGLEEEFSNVKFEWKERASSRLKFKYDEERRKYCSIIPTVYKWPDVSELKDDTVVDVSWKIPGIPEPYHTASQPISLTVRTCKKIVEISNVKIAPMPIPRWRVTFKVQDQFGEDMPGSVIDGLWAREKWEPKPWGNRLFHEEGDAQISSGLFNDTVGAKYDITLAIGVGVGHQWITIDNHLCREHDVELDLAIEK